MHFWANSVVKAIDEKFKAQDKTEEERIKLQIEDFKAKQQLIQESDIPAFFSQDPSTY